MEFIHVIEKILNKKAKIQYLPLQKGDVKTTYANISKIKRITNWRPRHNINYLLKIFIHSMKK